MILALAVVCWTLMTVPGTPAAQARDDPSLLTPLQVVVLADESASVTEQDVAREQDAARTIAFSLLAPGSELSVVGFGSANGPGQSPVDVVCPPTVLDTAPSRDAFVKCVGGLHRRTPAEGDDTDQAAALQQALSFVQAGKPANKVVFLLTDGKLDVSNSPAYGGLPDGRNAAARADADRTLDSLSREGAQVWPIGFGDVDAEALGSFARGDSCTPATERPRAQIVAGSAGLSSAVAAAFSSASCVDYGKTDTGSVPQGGSADLHVDVPAIGGDASIVVHKRDPRVQVAYFAPGQNKSAPSAGGATFSFAGQSTATESVQISDPTPGRWTVRLSSAVAANDVSATVVSQAGVRTLLTVNPPQPSPGQSVEVDMQVGVRNRAVVSPVALRGLSFTTTMTGAGFAAQQVRLTDADGDGIFSGTLTVPRSATGDLVFTGRVTGLGIGGDTRVLNSRIRGSDDAVQGSIVLDKNRATAHRGSTISGRVTVGNQSDRPQLLRLTATDVSPGSVFTADPPVFEVPPGASTTSFSLTVGEETALGMSAAILKVVSDAVPSIIVAESLFTTQITASPSLLYSTLSPMSVTILAAIAVTLVVILLWRFLLARRARRLVVRLYESGMLVHELTVPGRDARALRFSVLYDGSGSPAIRPARARDRDTYVLRRDGGGLDLRAPNSSHIRLAFGQRRQIGTNLGITVLSTGDTTDLDVHDGDLRGFPRLDPDDGFAYATAGADPFAAAEADARPVSSSGDKGGPTVAGEDTGSRSEPPPVPESRRLLAGHLPSTARLGAEISLTVRVVTEAGDVGQHVALMRPMAIGPTGAVVTLIVEGAPGLTALGPLEQQIHVPPDGDSDPVRFAFRTPTTEALLKPRVIAFAGGTFLAELTFQVSVSDRSQEPGTAPRVVGLPSLTSHRGEVTLHVRRDNLRYSFQLLSGDQWFDPVIVDSMAPGPDAATEATIAMLRRLAAGDTTYTPANTRKLVQGNGMALWNSLVPEAVREQFWQLRSQITAFTIATGTDTVPWELLYPNVGKQDEGFLVEQFPVNRWVYRQRRAERISLRTPRFIIPGGGPANAQTEAGAIHRILASGKDPLVISDLARLLDLLETEDLGLLHFACHNNFRPGIEGSAIEMADGDFVPALLERAKAQESLSAARPLVFINACRSAGATPHYTNMMGFAQQFLTAGAGAFVGTLWDVRSSSAQTFAEEFYRLLMAGESLGSSAWRARMAASKADDDPTWLAYTVYGDPQALPIGQ